MEPSMSVKRKVTVPVGRLNARGLLGESGRNLQGDVRQRASSLLGADMV